MQIRWIDLGNLGELINPVDTMTEWQDHGLGLLRTIMHKNGVFTQLGSVRACHDWQEVGSILYNADIILMNVRSYTFGIAHNVAKIYKGINPNGKVIVGGMHATVSPEEMAGCPEFDHIVQGGGEDIICDLVQNHEKYPRIIKAKGAKSMADWPMIDRTLWPQPHRDFVRPNCWPLEGSIGWGPPPVATVFTNRVCPWQCSFCLSADTVIHTLQGQRTIRQLIDAKADQFEVFSCDSKGNLKVGIAHSIRKTRVDAPVWKVTLDDGTSFKATDDHPIMRRDGTYSPVAELSPGDSLMPFNWQYRKLGRSKGEYLWGRTHPEGSMIPLWRWRILQTGVSLSPKQVVHHCNFDSKDNCLENLQVMSKSAHQSLHAKLGIGVKGAKRSPETRRKMGAAKIGNKNGKFRKPETLRRQGERLAKYNRTRDYTHSDETRKKIAAARTGKKNSAESRQKMSEVRKAYWANKSKEERSEVTEKARAGHSSDWREKVAKTLKGKGIKLSEERRKQMAEAIHKFWDAKSPEERRVHLAKATTAARVRNHKIVSIEFAGYEDVYDLTVDDYHNFAIAGGVFAHNCSEASYIPHMARKPVDMVIDELNFLDETYGPLGSVVIHDSMFFQQPAWLREWLDKYPKRANKIWPYWAAGRADTVRKWPELFERLVKETNWNTVSIGFESGSQRSLKMLNKECSVWDNLFAISLLNRIGDEYEERPYLFKAPPPKFFANIMIGIPGETREDTFETFRMLLTIKRKIVPLSTYSPYPGSVLGHQLIAEGMSLVDKNSHNRYPGQCHMKGVDNQFYEELMAGEI